MAAIAATALPDTFKGAGVRETPLGGRMGTWRGAGEGADPKRAAPSLPLAMRAGRGGCRRIARRNARRNARRKAILTEAERHM